MKAKKFFRASGGEIGATRLYTLPSAVAVPLQNTVSMSQHSGDETKTEVLL